MILPVEGGVVVLDLHLEGFVFPEFAGRGFVGGAGQGFLHRLHVPPEFGRLLLVADHVEEARHGHVLLGHGDLDFLLGGGRLPWDLEIAEPGDLVTPVLGVGKIADPDTVIHELADEHLEMRGERRPLPHRAGTFLRKHAVILEAFRVLAELRLHGEQGFDGKNDVVVTVRHLLNDLRALQEVRVRQR